MEVKKVESYSVYEKHISEYVMNKQRRRMIMLAVGFLDLIVKWIIGF